MVVGGRRKKNQLVYLSHAAISVIEVTWQCLVY